MNASNDNHRAVTRDQAQARRAEEERLAAVRAGHYVGAKHRDDAKPADIKRGIVADIKAALASGALPAGLEVRVSVRASRGSCLNRTKVDLCVTKLPRGFSIYSAARIRADLEGRNCGLGWMAPEAEELVAKLEAIANAYGYDRSDSMTDHFDCAFWLSAGFDAGLRMSDRERIEAAVRAAFGPA